MRDGNITVEHVDQVVTPLRSVEEVILHVDRADGRRTELPLAVAADRDENSYLRELRVDYSSWPTGDTHLVRTPMFQFDPECHASGVVGEYQQALAAGDVERTVAAFEPGGFVREPSGLSYVHQEPTSCARSSRASSPTAAASRSSTARSPTTASRARSSTTSSPGGDRARAPGRHRRLRARRERQARGRRIDDDVDPPLGPT